MLNKVILTGRLTATPELRKTSSDVSVTSFSVAVQRQYKGPDGNYPTDFINCVAWRNTADFICKFFEKGQLIALVGSLQSRNYEDKTGAKRTAFEVVADAATKPCILYNVPSRTGCNIMPATMAELADHPNIVAVKEASGNLSQIAEIAALTRGKLDIYSGNDDQILPVLSLGGKGVISVLSNILPKETSMICKNYFNGNTAEATKMQLDYLALINALFCEVNPIPVKTAMNLLGYNAGPLRLPLCEMEEKNLETLKAALKHHNLI